MTASRGKDQRDVVPRWRPFRDTVRAGELRQSGPRLWAADDVEIAENERAFLELPGVHTASDLVGAALVLNVYPDSARDAAQFVLRSEASGGAKKMANRLLRQDAHQERDVVTEQTTVAADLERQHRRVHKLRCIVQAEPKNSVRWADLALAHAALGQTKQATREIQTALALSPENRFILRVAASFFVHIGDPELANHLLTRAPVAAHDPWLLSAELATAEIVNKASRRLRRAARALVEDDFSPWHVSELASELATTELRAGHDKDARRLMTKALVDPTENALAQAQWAEGHGVSELIGQEVLERRSNNFEALARRSVQEQEWDDAVRQGLLWQADQTFSLDPAIFTSYTAAVGAADFHASVQAARVGLIANPGDGTLLNNLAFALANLNDPLEAARVISQWHEPGDARNQAVETATRGLISFRSGSVAEGRDLYRSAVSHFRAMKHDELEALALLFWAREELIAHTLEAPSLVRLADEVSRRTPLPEVILWHKRVLDLIDKRDARA